MEPCSLARAPLPMREGVYNCVSPERGVVKGYDAARVLWKRVFISDAIRLLLFKAHYL